ncbi:polyprenyl synthetase family protein [Sporolactobacillus vineae]|uniref:polyprenyl synthetase family protein n=1 Tax=Sporolactobacillus vineae TaxID=444463 RepID=UPI000287C408|nr:polyprenyl synthetase family protein [Sporolactobacillus vineae]
MSLAQIYLKEKKNLNIIERKLESYLQAPYPLLREASLDLLHAGGKRIRPILVLLASQYGDPDRKEVLDSAVTLELIHMASLVHDDVVDDSGLRRGKPTVKAKWDNRVAMFTGDYIFARAIELISRFDHVQAHRMISKVIRDLSLGEIDQIRDLYNLNQNLRAYLLRIKRKTAILMALSCQLGGYASGCSLSLSGKLYYFGYCLGMSYQITDDILDFVGTEKQLGKPAGSDLRSGNITLPAFYALQDRQLHDAVAALLQSDQASDEEWQALIQAICASDAIARSEQLSDRYLDKARKVLKQLPQIPATKALEEIAGYVGTRNY